MEEYIPLVLGFVSPDGSPKEKKTKKAKKSKEPFGFHQRGGQKANGEKKRNA